MRTGYEENVVEWFLLKNENILVQIKDHDVVDDIGNSKKNCTNQSIGVIHFISLENINE